MRRLDTAIRVLAFVSLLGCALAGASQAANGNTDAAYAYVCAAAWVVIYLTMREE